MTLPRPPVTRRQFFVHLVITVGLVCIHDFVTDGLLFGPSSLRDFLITIGFSLGVFFGMRMMASYYESLLGCLLVAALLLGMMLPMLAKLSAAGDKSFISIFGAMSQPFWVITLASNAENFFEVQWRKQPTTEVSAAFDEQSEEAKEHD